MDPSGPEFRKAAVAANSYEMNKKMQWARDQADRALDYLEENQVRILPWYHSLYPQSMLAIKNFPPLLYIKGMVPKHPNIAVVGTRQPSPLAETKVVTMVTKAIEAGFGIVSGLALGIDTMAHQAALQLKGYTLAVLPFSLDKTYPPENHELAMAILEQGGTLVSEQPPFMEPMVNPFVLRNRLQSALSQYVIPVEMGISSGTAYTIRYAVQQGRKVILCKPSGAEIDHYMPQYAGMLTTIARYKFKRDQVIMIPDISDLAEVFQAKDPSSQGTLF
jgi:DNA processing protein